MMKFSKGLMRRIVKGDLCARVFVCLSVRAGVCVRDFLRRKPVHVLVGYFGSCSCACQPLRLPMGNARKCLGAFMES